MNYSSTSIKTKYRELTSHKKKRSTGILVLSFKSVIMLIVFLGIGISCLGFGAFKGILDSAPNITLNDVTPSQYKTTVYDSNNIVTETLVASGANRVYVTFDEIPDNLKNAFIAIEDERFYEHNGIDPKGMIRALYDGLTTLHFNQGASTITQQLIKNSVFEAENEKTMLDTVKRKIQEQYLALKLEEEVQNKDVILENYLNTINLGNNNLGVQSAAMNYFNKDVSELTLSECAVIAAITQNPYQYNPIRFPEENAKRRAKVLKNMLEQKLITQDAYNEAVADDVYSRIMDVNDSTSGSTAYSYYTDALIKQIMEDLMTQKGYTYTQAYNLVYRGGLSIYSNEDSKLQDYAESIINDPKTWGDMIAYTITYRFQITDKDGNQQNYTESDMLKWMQSSKTDAELLFASTDEADKAMAEFKSYVLKDTGGTLIDNSESHTYTLEPQTSLVLTENGTGKVRVLIGGRGDKTESLVLNRATSSERQAGSSIKPLLVYAPALDTAGFTLATVVDDVPFYYDSGQRVKNNDGKYLGYVTLRQALAESRNVPAIKVLKSIGITTGTTYLKNFGITTLTENDNYLPIALGTCSVTNYEMTNAYTTFANGGEYITPTLYSKVLDHDGNVILDNSEPESTRVIKETTAWLMQSAMHSVTTSGTLSWVNMGGMYVSAKTGTTQNNYDKWVIGYTSAFTCGVWAGYDSNKELAADNNPVHITIWNQVLQKANEGKDVSKAPEAPSGIVSVEVCKDSGLLAVDGLCDNDPRGSRVETEYFESGTEPTQSCNVHTKVTIDSATGDIASSSTPASRQKTVVRIIKDLSGVNLNGFVVEDEKYSITKEMLEKAKANANNNNNKPTQPETSSSSAETTTETPTTSSTGSTTTPQETTGETTASQN